MVEVTPSFTAYLNGSLTLSSEGIWIHEGVAFTNEKLISLFHRSIVWNEQQKGYLLQIGQYRASFSLEGVPYFVRSLDDSVSPWRLHLLDGSDEALKPESLTVSASHEIFCEVKGGHNAKFLHGAHQTLLAHTVNDHEIQIGGQIVRIREALCRS